MIRIFCVPRPRGRDMTTLSFIESPFSTKVAYEAYLKLPEAQQAAAVATAAMAS